MPGADLVPIALFAHARPDHVRRTLAALEANHVPKIYAFSDAAKRADQRAAVDAVRELLRAVSWCEMMLVERPENLGLGRSILAGVTHVLSRHDSAIIVEDDLLYGPGAYAYSCAALARYRDEPRVTSVAAWNHQRLTPDDVRDQPYFSGRPEIWVWGTWARAWRDMERTALSLLRECRAHGIDVYRYGADLPAYAAIESDRNIWAVRFIYAQMLRGGLQLCPPWSMVENIGFDAAATNTSGDSGWSQPNREAPPPIPSRWPEPVEHRDVPALCRRAYGEKPGVFRRWSGDARRSLGRIARSAGWIPQR